MTMRRKVGTIVEAALETYLSRRAGASGERLVDFLET